MVLKFGRKEWGEYLGDVGEEPTLPSDLETIISQPCPFWPRKKVYSTHYLVLIPEMVGGEAFHLNSLGSFLANMEIRYQSFDKFVSQEYGNFHSSSHWILMTYDVIPNSRRLRFEQQKKMIKGVELGGVYPYRLPSVLEAATCLVAIYLHKGKRLLSDDPWTYTRCREMVNQSQYPISIGGFTDKGFYIHDCRYAPTHDYIGVAAVREMIA